MIKLPTLEVLMRMDDEAWKKRQQAQHVPVSSGFTKETLKQAIADAKAVRATALANARQALEEAFSKKFEDALAPELQKYRYD